MMQETGKLTVQTGNNKRLDLHRETESLSERKKNPVLMFCACFT